ncbi:copG protein [alpha proteobacterium U9-1i]|nr:copG protein [alpha proteobacterium U9-1i]
MAHIEQTGRFQTSTRDERDMPAVKQRLRVPSDLVSCHTAEVAGFVIEGHVPAEDVLRLLRDRPHGVIGLAVPGMPLGSPGMEQDGGDARQAFDVLAFRSDGARESFARYDARA